MGLAGLAALSREYGRDERYVLAGGGNTSFKDDQYLFVKASGVPLSAITEAGFVKLHRQKLAQIWEREYPVEPDLREKSALADLMGARSKGDLDKRPSVETLLHDLIPHRYVVHTHPALVNGLTCGSQGEQAAAEVFGRSCLWVPSCNPGYVLSKRVKAALDRFRKKRGQDPALLLLQNHGIFVYSSELAGIRQQHTDVFARLEKRIQRWPDFSPVSIPDSERFFIEEQLKGVGAVFLCILSFANREVARLVENPETFNPISSALTPDHIVYSGHKPLFVEQKRIHNLKELVVGYRERELVYPKVVAVQKLGLFCCGGTLQAAERAAKLILDAIKVSIFAESFGGFRFMDHGQIEFIRGWEVEHYREKQKEER